MRDKIELRQTENENRDYILSKIRDHFLDEIKKEYGQEYEIDKEIYVPFKQIYIPKGDEIELGIWCFKQDICIFKTVIGGKSKNYSINIDDNKPISIKLKVSPTAALPLLIIETKMAKVNTHELLAYSEKVRMIKTIFPYCKFILLSFGEPTEKVYWHCGIFDRIISINNFEEKEIKKIIDFIRVELSEVKTSIDNITKVTR